MPGGFWFARWKEKLHKRLFFRDLVHVENLIE